MKYQVQFKEKKRNCCPPAFYWVVKDSVIVADNEQDLIYKLNKGRYAVEVQKITPIE